MTFLGTIALFPLVIALNLFPLVIASPKAVAILPSVGVHFQVHPLLRAGLKTRPYGLVIHLHQPGFLLDGIVEGG